MAWQSTLEQVKSIRLTRTTVTGLIIGIVLGLTLGLLIGWVWWPVEWQGTDASQAGVVSTTDTVDDGSLFATPEARSLYLGAVADAYVYASNAGDREAAALAAQRLAALGGDIRSAIERAISYYSVQPDGSTRVANLTTLATAVGLAPAANQSAVPAATAGAPAGEAGQGGVATTGDEQGGGWSWIITILIALILIGGGLYILWLLRRGDGEVADVSAGERAGKDGFLPEEESAPQVSSTYTRSSLSPSRVGVTPAASMRSSVERPVASEGSGPHGFDAEKLDDESYPPLHRSTATTTLVRPETGGYAGGYPAAAAESDDEPDDEYEDESGDDVEEWDDEERGPAQSAADGDAGEADEEDENGDAQEGDEGHGPVRGPAAKALPGTAVSARTPLPGLQPPTPSRFGNYKQIDSYTATYYSGQVDFDTARNVENPNGDGYIGEYGVGIPEKNGLLHNDLEQAIAVEVYLFDKTEDRQMLTVSRLLLSEYAHDRLYEEFQRNKQSLAPIVARPETHFQLEGKQLLLDCLIRQVTFTPEGIFRSMTLELVLKRQG